MTLTVGSLFSGIGGLDLGLERAGMKVIWQSEIDPYANKILKKHWPEVPNHGNIKEINWETVERPNVICGGYPCQPFSTAGKRRGEEDPRHLWPWVRDAISRLRPDYAILENVRGHLSMGGLSVIGDLASIGYDAEWRVVSAASVGANHRRDRIIIVAYPTSKCCNGVNHHSRDCEQSETTAQFGNGGRSQNVAYTNDARPHTAQINTAETGINAFGGAGGCSANVANTDNTRGRASQCGMVCGENTHEAQVNKQSESGPFNGACGCGSNVANTAGEGLQGSIGTFNEGNGNGFACSCEPISNDERQWDGQHRIPGDAGQENRRRVYNGTREIRYDGWQWWQVEPDVGRVANGVPSRVDRLRGLGNAVVPQVAEVIGRLVVAHAETI